VPQPAFVACPVAKMEMMKWQIICMNALRRRLNFEAIDRSHVLME
jgi:hypothetical protein